jgi:Spy/CpxP family protein refolding chaperone
MKRLDATLIGMIAILALASFALANPLQSAGQSAPPSPGPAAMADREGGPAHEFGMEGHHEGPMGMLQKKLGLTDEQKKQMRLIYIGFLDRTRKARMGLRGLKDEQRTMMMSGSVDQKKLAQMDEQKVKFVSEVMTERLKMRRDRLALLTPEQLDRLGGMIAMKGCHHKMHRGHWGGGGGHGGHSD